MTVLLLINRMADMGLMHQLWLELVADDQLASHAVRPCLQQPGVWYVHTYSLEPSVQ